MLEKFLIEKKWNPYCFRHSAISHDSDYLPGYALNKKVCWTMSSKQPNRYIKNRLSNDLKYMILAHNGVVVEEVAKPKATVLICPKCQQPNSLESKFCMNPKCTSYPLTPLAYEEVKAEENSLKERLVKLEEEKEQTKIVILELLNHQQRYEPIPQEEWEKLKQTKTQEVINPILKE